MLLDLVIAVAYAGIMGVLVVYGLHRVALLRRFTWEARSGDGERCDADLPSVTVQLPLFNERTVAARLVRAVGELEYPRERLEIQVLDDSTDETKGIVDAEVAELVARGIDAKVVRREGRVGFKAGALDHGLKSAKGELVAIFDADFLPRTGFLKDLVDAFDDPGVGMVQARWGHENREENTLTRAEATLLDGHFVVEHKVRCDSGWFFNFNGTAGIWRRLAIDDAGGWQHDTLTEDLDLSYRAQLAGWRFVYRPQVVAPAEVPADIAAFKSQQHRWAKGSVQVLRKLGGRIVAADVPWRTRVEALAHLTGNVGYPCVFALALLLPLALGVNERVSHWVHLGAFVMCTVSVVMFYERSQRALARSVVGRMRDTVTALVLGIGMSLSQTRAVLEGWFGGTGVFVRTPKSGGGTTGRYSLRLAGLPGAELLVAGWFVWGMVSAVERGLWGSLPFLLLFFASFAWVGVLSVGASLRRVA